jgi:hypothetical protein
VEALVSTKDLTQNSIAPLHSVNQGLVKMLSVKLKIFKPLIAVYLCKEMQMELR